jgi:hypothetical protein
MPGEVARSAPRRSRARRLALLALLALPFLAEVAVRAVFAAPTYMEGMAFDPELGYRQPSFLVLDGRPDPEGAYSYRTNSLGFRSPELPGEAEPPPPGTTRLFFVGDSFLAGVNVRPDDVLPFSCEAALRARGHAVEAYNISYRGIGTAQELLLFRRHAESVRPGVVVLVFYVGNDVVDNTPELVGRTTVSSGAYVRPFLLSDGRGGLETVWLDPARAWLRARSRIFQALEIKLLNAGLVEDPAAADQSQTAEQRIAAGHLPDRSLEVFRSPEPLGPWEAGWKRTEDLLRAFRSEVEALGARFVLVVVPHRYQVQKDGVSRVLDEWLREARRPALDELVDWNLPERRIGAFAAAEGFVSVPLLDALREATAATRKSHYLFDGHLDSRGHRLAGTLLAGVLAEVLAGRSPPPAQAPAGAPIELLGPDYVAEARVDFSTSYRAEVLLSGWRWWQPVGDAGAAGWVMAEGRSVLWFPLRAGELVLEGWAAVPGLSLRLFVRGRTLRPPIRLENAGPFAVRIPIEERNDMRRSGQEHPLVQLLFVLDDESQGSGARLFVTGLRLE